MSDDNIYIGRPGNLVSIPLAKGGISGTRVQRVDTFQLANGGMRVGKIIDGGSRRYSLNYAGLDYLTFKKIEAFDQGHEGPGPFVLLDPGRRNILTVNQSSATSAVNDTDNFTVSGSGGTLSSEATTVLRGPRSLKWSFAFTGPSSAVLTLDSPAIEWSGFPVHIGRDMVFSCYVRGGGTDAIMTVTASITWLDTAGATLSTSTGSGAASSSGAWTQVFVTGDPPASSAYCTLKITVTGNTISSGGILYLDQFQFEEGTAAPTVWYPGTGIKPVMPVSFNDVWPYLAPTYRDQPTLVLQEVG